jgi:hypothetical protein
VPLLQLGQGIGSSAEQGALESELAKLQASLAASSGSEEEGASGEEEESGVPLSPGAGSLSADGSRARVEGSTGAEGPVDLKNVVAMLAHSQLQMAAKIEQGFQKLQSEQRKAARLSDESKIIDGARNQGEFNRYMHA